jgi:hypothetical protein
VSQTLIVQLSVTRCPPRQEPTVLVVARANPQKYEKERRYQIAQSALWAHPAITASSIVV